jgi:hypothetical protein
VDRDKLKEKFPGEEVLAFYFQGKVGLDWSIFTLQAKINNVKKATPGQEKKRII